MPVLSHGDGSPNIKTRNDFLIRIREGITLCYIVDDFESFTENLKDFSKGINGRSNLEDLYKYILNGKKVSKKIRDFYVNNYKVLDTIHKNTYISNFLLIYFDRKNGKFDDELIYMHKYIKENKNEIDIIIANLEKIEKLGFYSIYFKKWKNFDDVYEYDCDDLYFYYLDGNIEIIPSMSGLKYKSINANYQIKMGVIEFAEKEIEVNNLTFDINNLPDEINVKKLRDQYLSLKKQNVDSFNALNDTVSSEYYLEKLINSIEKMDDVINDIHNCKDKDLAKKYINNTKQNITNLQFLLEIYEQDLIDQGLLSEKVLEEEKLKYYRTYK